MTTLCDDWLAQKVPQGDRHCGNCVKWEHESTVVIDGKVIRGGPCHESRNADYRGKLARRQFSESCWWWSAVITEQVTP